MPTPHPSSPTPSTRTDAVFDRAPVAMSALLFIWLVLLRYIPAHPVEQPVSLLFLSAALLCVTGARLVHAPRLRRVILGAAVVLVMATFWWL